ncbi:hypothetical protein [Kitasatospora sp. NPDC004289]
MNNQVNPVVRRATALIANTPGGPAEIAAALAARGELATPVHQVAGPYPLGVRANVTTAVLDPHTLIAALFRGLAREFVEDPDGVGEELTALAEASGPAADELMEELLLRLGGTEMVFPASAVRVLAERMLAAVGPAPVPVQGVAA